MVVVKILQFQTFLAPVQKAHDQFSKLPHLSILILFHQLTNLKMFLR